MKGLETLAILLAPYAPFAAEECWALLGHDVAAGDSVHAQSWPTADPALLVEDDRDVRRAGGRQGA